MAWPSGWIAPAWPAPANVRAACSTRAGGVSVGPYESLNLGDHVGDDAAAVATNRKKFRQTLAARPVFLRQVHGRSVASLDARTPDGTEADGCFTRESGVACTIMVADCLPILFAVADGSAVAAAHAGWRGLAGEAGEAGEGVVESVVHTLLRESNARPADVLAWLGPCIGPGAFEVGAEVKAAFESQDAQWGAHFRPHTPGKWLADLPALARVRLRALGIARIHGNDGGTAWCTVSNPSRFFSHRRDRVSGRFAAAVWRA
jgi:YfiH family protein